MNLVYRIEKKNPNWRSVVEKAIAEIRKAADCGDVMLRLSDVLRSLDQNAKQWPMLNDIAQQVDWRFTDDHGRWQVAKMSDFDWKDVLTASFRKATRMAEGVDGGVVMIGLRTSEFKKREFSEWIEWLYAFGSENGVIWSEKSQDHYEMYGERKH